MLWGYDLDREFHLFLELCPNTTLLGKCLLEYCDELRVYRKYQDNQPYQNYINSGYFEVKEKTFLTPYRGQQSYTQTKITGKGQIYLSNKLKKLGYKI